ncbi:MAG: hypothetical protein ISS36_00645 [Candidatus Aenigmarchaeota archaeon]|nr:hypothetical protein [Candidatus Aenigmarchaeota archaeon]
MPIGPGYVTEDDDDIYKKKKEEAEAPIETLLEDLEDEYEEKPVEERVETVIKRRSMPKMEETKIQPLERLAPNIIGGLFDRVEFLKTRIEEIEKTIEMRGKIHQDVLDDIDVDLLEKERMMEKVGDLDEKRAIKLDMSILRKEKRSENLQFWRDILELRTEFRELSEQFETEKKIVKIFKGR